MNSFGLKRFFLKSKPDAEGELFLPVQKQIKAWQKANRKIPFMAFADYDIAPYGYEDFFDAPQMFCSNGILGLGIGHVDRNYPLFGISTLRFE